MSESREIERMKIKMGKELLWPYILTILKKGPNHAYEIRKMLNEKFGLDTNSVLTYLVLYKMREKGYIKNKDKDGKVIYTITKKGRELIREGKRKAKEIVKSWK